MATYPGTEGDDAYTGTDDRDTIHGLDGDDVLSGGGDADTIYGDDGDDTLDGDAGNDVLYAGAGSNIMRGGAGDDFLNSAGGTDSIDGGTGYDSWIVNFATLATRVVFDETDGSIQGSTFVDIERLLLTTGYGADRFGFTTLDFVLDSGAGRDALTIDLSDAAQPVEWSFNAVSDGTYSGSSLGSRSTFVHVETVSFVGTNQSDQVALSAAAAPVSDDLALDSGLGSDRLTIDAKRVTQFDFLQNDDGSVSAAFGEFRNFEAYTINLAPGTQNSTIETGGGADSVTQALQSDSSNDNIVTTGDGDDYVIMIGDRNTIDAGAGDDSVNLTGSANHVAGGDGFDYLSLARVYHLDFDDRTGKISDDTYISGFENVRIHARGRDDSLYLTSGSKISIDAGGGHNTAVVDLSTRPDGVLVSFDRSEVEFDDTFAYRIEEFSFLGGSGDDYVRCYYVLPTSIAGGDGIDTLDSTVTDLVELVVQDDGTIVTNLAEISGIEVFKLNGSVSNSTIRLGAYDDTLSIFGDRNTLAGGAGDDTIGTNYSAIGTRIFGEDGDDLIDAGSGETTSAFARGGDGDDQVNGGYGADQLFGGDGADVLKGGSGDDLLGGGLGDDILDGQDGVDTANYQGAAGAVVVRLAVTALQDTHGAGRDLLVSVENLVGSLDGDRLSGDHGANRLDGSDGNDRLAGGGGADTIVGGTGADRMAGGAGADTFAFGNRATVPPTGRDVILDFSHLDGDRINLSAVDAETGPGDQAFTFIGADRFSGDGGELRVRPSSEGAVLVLGDVDGDGKADFSFLVHTDAPLVAADFVL